MQEVSSERVSVRKMAPQMWGLLKETSQPAEIEGEFNPSNHETLDSESTIACWRELAEAASVKIRAAQIEAAVLAHHFAT